MAIADGLRKNITREGLQQTLASNTFEIEGAAGKIAFQPSGDRANASILVKVSKGDPQVSAMTLCQYAKQGGSKSRLVLYHKDGQRIAPPILTYLGLPICNERRGLYWYFLKTRVTL